MKKNKPGLDMLEEIKNDCLRTILYLHHKTGSGHIGTSLSCLELLVSLYFYEMQEHDKFILSKGHAASALYTMLAKSGRISEQLLDTFCENGTILPAHPPCSGKLNGVPFGTGSLGHGLSLAAGIALSSKFTNENKFRVFCLLSDGDCNEGSTWEAALFIAQHKLTNLTVVVDKNNLQGFGSSPDILCLDPLDAKFSSFGFTVKTIKNGNNLAEIMSVFSDDDPDLENRPLCIIANTIKGHGISFMENKVEWHYLPMTDEQYKQALNEIHPS